MSFVNAIGKRIKFAVVVLFVMSLAAGPAMMGHAEASAKPEAECVLSGEDLASAKAYLRFKKLKESFVPKGVPDVYGPKLGVSFDRVQDAINKVRIFDPTYGNNKIVLEGADLKRYISIGSRIACEYCCSAKTLVRQDGVAACGCAHSQMMRGLAAYLIKSSPQMSDELILTELKTWKAAYFPKQTLNTELVKLYKSGDTDIKDVLKEFPEFLPSMVGGC